MVQVLAPVMMATAFFISNAMISDQMLGRTESLSDAMVCVKACISLSDREAVASAVTIGQQMHA